MNWQDQALHNVYNYKVINELDYILKCLSFVEEKISKETQFLNIEYDGAIKKESVEGLIPDELHDYFYDQHFHFDSISKTIIESILIRQISIVEKHLVEMSYMVYKELTLEQKPILPPHCKCGNKESFSDAIKAMIFIETELGIKIKHELNSVWKPFKLIREHLRHKLAHGENSFLLSNDQAHEINKLFQGDLLEFKDSHYIKQGNKNYEKSLESIVVEQDDSTEYETVEDPFIIDCICSKYKICTNYSVLSELNLKLRELALGTTKMILDKISK